MEANNNINPRYLSFSTDEVQHILAGVEHIDEVPTDESEYPVMSKGVKKEIDNRLAVAKEEDVRSIVTNYIQP